MDTQYMMNINVNKYCFMNDLNSHFLLIIFVQVLLLVIVMFNSFIYLLTLSYINLHFVKG
jgi:hypothetical protein